MADNKIQIQYNGLTLGGTSDNYLVSNLQGVDGLEIRTSEALKTGGHGGSIYNSLYGMRIIAFNGTIKGTDADDFLEKKANLIQAFSITDNDTLTISFWDTDATTRVIQAKVIQTPMIVYQPGEPNFATYRIELKCGEPFFKDVSDSSYTINLENTNSLGGPLGASGGPVSMALGGGDATNRQVIINSGDIDWYLDSIKFTGEVNTPRLTNLATGEAIYYDSTITTASYINITKGQDGYYATDQNGINVLEDIVGDYPEILKGDNALVFSASVYSAQASCTLVWRNRYLNIY